MTERKQVSESPDDERLESGKLKIPKLAIVVPCYNEEAVLPETTRRLEEVISSLVASCNISPHSFILFVNDGSKDLTWPIISQYAHERQYVCGVNLAGNVGHQHALWAGLYVATQHADIMITIDADLQDDVNAIAEMVAKYAEGYDIVYGVRNKRETDTWFKRTTALAFYKLMHFMGIKSVYNHADYRLMSKRAVDFLLEFPERNLFLRGMVPLIGYKTTSVYYDRSERFAGESKYPLKKMISFAVDGITSFSVKPIHFLLYVGFAFIIISICILCWALYEKLQGATVSGWTSTIMSIWFIGGTLLLAIGIVGEYVGKTFMETKRRPRFNIEDVILNDEVES